MIIICSILSAIKSVRHIHHTVEHIQLRQTRNSLLDRIRIPKITFQEDSNKIVFNRNKYRAMYPSFKTLSWTYWRVADFIVIVAQNPLSIQVTLTWAFSGDQLFSTFGPWADSVELTTSLVRGRTHDLEISHSAPALSGHRDWFRNVTQSEAMNGNMLWSELLGAILLLYSTTHELGRDWEASYGYRDYLRIKKTQGAKQSSTKRRK